MIPEIRLAKTGDDKGTITKLSNSEQQKLQKQANGDASIRKLKDYLAKNEYEPRSDLIDGARCTKDALVVDMLMLGYDGPGQGASLIYTTGTLEGESIKSSFVWIVGDNTYIYNTNQQQVEAFPEGKNRMQGVPRLPRESDLAEDTGLSMLLANPVHADHCPCHNEWSECYVANALCASLTAGCIVGCVPCCGGAAGACTWAAIACNVAALCGPAC